MVSEKKIFKHFYAFRHKKFKKCGYDNGHMTKMAAMPIYVEITSKYSRPEALDRFYESWYVGSATPAHHNLYTEMMTLN